MEEVSTGRKIAVAARKLLDQKGPEAVTMRRVAGSVGITAMAVYRHYPDRKAVLNTLADEGFEQLAAKLENTRFAGDVEQRLGKFLDVYLDFALQYPRLFELMFLEPREGARQFPRDFKAGKSPTANLMAELIQQGMNTGYFREDDVWAIVFEMGALLQGLIILYLGGRMGLPVSGFRRFCHQSFRRYMHGICK